MDAVFFVYRLPFNWKFLNSRLSCDPLNIKCGRLRTRQSFMITSLLLPVKLNWRLGSQGMNKEPLYTA